MEDLSVTLIEWLNIATRWMHVFAAIMWVGQTYFFTWLDGRFTELFAHTNSGSPNAEEHVWMVHSGGFYLVGKQKKPTLMPTKLHWFRWEAAITWLSGITLLILVYYMGGLMVDENMEETTPIIVGIATIILGWPVYDFLWKSKFASSNQAAAIIVSYILLVAVIIMLTKMMDGRAAYIHVGAILGTIMTANVWQRIIPAQRKLVAALTAGHEPDLALGEIAKTRSKHNTFIVVPVVFIMISNHYPVTSYGDSWNWVILSVLILIGWGVAKVIRKA